MKKPRVSRIDSVIREIDPDEEILSLRSQLKDRDRRLAAYKQDTGDLRGFFRDIALAIEAIRPAKTVYRKPLKKSKVSSPISACFHDTDGHMGAVQDKDEIEGINEFSPEICRARKMYAAQKFLEWVEVERSGHTIPEAVWINTGDNISGDIHDELKITNAFPAPVQVVEAGLLLADQVALIAPHFEIVRVEMPSEDNHGRLTKKPQAAQAGYNSLNYVAGWIAKERLREIKNVRFNLYPQYMKTIEVRGRRYIVCHGHWIRQWVGFPYYGAERMASRESMRRMQLSLGGFDRIILGHFHAPLRHPWYWIGGSVQGTTALDHSNSRYADPSQAAWLVHPRHGEFNAIDFKLNTL